MRIAPILSRFDKLVKGFFEINSSFLKSLVFPAIAEIAQPRGLGGVLGTPAHSGLAPKCKNEVVK